MADKLLNLTAVAVEQGVRLGLSHGQHKIDNSKLTKLRDDYIAASHIEDKTALAELLGAVVSQCIQDGYSRCRDKRIPVADINERAAAVRAYLRQELA